MKIFCLPLAATIALVGCNVQKGAQLPPPPLPVGLTNETCPAPVPSVNTMVSHSSGEANNPVIVAKDLGFYVAWWDWFGKNPTISGIFIKDDGIPTDEETLFPSQKKCSLPTLAADGDNVYVSWLDGSEASHVTIGQNEQKPKKFGKTSRFVASGPWGAVVWEELGTLWFRNDGMLGLPGRDGSIPEPRPLAVAQGGIESPAIAWTGEFYAVVWSDAVSGGRNIVMQRVTNRGELFGPKIQVSGVGGYNNRPQVVWTGTDFAVAWTNAAPAEHNPLGNFRIFMAIIPKEGVRPSFTKQLDFNGSADVVSLATTGAELAMAWVGTKKPAGSAVYFRRFDLEGNLIGEQLRVSDDNPAAVGRPFLTFGRGGYGVVWHDSREFEGAEIFFSFLACSASELPVADTDDASDTVPPESQLKSVF
ncbi:MAG: hypothetical protein JXX29_20005 [Deltaproteobacteria bacterium]|nr:hypothetical protein [Deltaproteobacteria bacterium]MBN2673976.1 hypothetical protein [Deltaproteobacteria bacterium]